MPNPMKALAVMVPELVMVVLVVPVVLGALVLVPEGLVMRASLAQAAVALRVSP